MEFREFMRGRRATMVRLAYGLTGDLGDAEDVAQAAFARVYASGGGYGRPATRARTSGRSWSTMIAGSAAPSSLPAPAADANCTAFTHITPHLDAGSRAGLAFSRNE
jgi:hypothetical protein